MLLAIKRLTLIMFLIFTNYYAHSKDYFPFIESKFKKVKSFNNWHVFVKNLRYENDYTACFVLSTSTKSRPFVGIRDLPYFLVNFSNNELTISAVAGYEIAKYMILSTNNVSYMLNKESAKFAITSSSVQDKAILEELIKDGYSFTLKSYNTSDETTVDFYPLIGFKEALNYMQNNCSIRSNQMGSTESTSGI